MISSMTSPTLAGAILLPSLQTERQDVCVLPQALAGNNGSGWKMTAPNDRNAFWRLRGKYMLFFAEKDKLFTTVLSFKYIREAITVCIFYRYCRNVYQDDSHIISSWAILYIDVKKVHSAKTYLHDGTIRIACIIIITTFPEVALFVLLNRIMLIFRAWKEQLFQV